MKVNELNRLARELREEDGIESAIVRGVANDPVTQASEIVLEVNPETRTQYFHYNDLEGVDVFGIRRGALILS